MKTKIIKFDFIIVLVYLVIHFFSLKNVIPDFISVIVAIMLSIYLFPIRMLTLQPKGVTINKKIILFFFHFVFGSLVIFSSLSLYSVDSSMVKTVLITLLILSYISLITFYFIDEFNKHIPLVLVLLFLASFYYII